MLALFEHRVKMHRHAAHLALGVLLAGCCEYLVRVLVRLRAHAEHIELVADEVALSEALTGKGLLQQLHLLFIGVALLADSLGVDAGDYAGVLRTLHASLYLEACDTRLFETAYLVYKTVVLKRERMVVHAAAEAVLQAAGLRAESAVAAAAAYEGGHIALAGMAEAERAVNKHLGLDRGVLGDEPYLLERQLARKHGTGNAHLRRGLDAGEVMQAHLRARVQRDIGQRAADGIGHAEILHDERVRARVRRELRRGDGVAHLTVVHEGVERDIDLTAADMAVSHRLHEFLICEIFRAAAGVERAHTHVYGVRSVLHGGDNALRRAGGGQKFYHCSYLLHYNTE